MWRSKRNAAVNMTEDGPPLFIMGPCSPSACSKETACVKLEDKGQSKHRCLCTHDLRPPAADGSCSRHIVNEKPGRIPNVQPPSLKTVDKNTSDVSTIPSVVPTISPVTEVDSGTNLMVPVTCVIIVGVLILVVFILLYLKRKSRMNEKMASPMNLKQNLLVAERYAPNPQYSACSGAGVPVLRRDTLRFLDELGEGCFGKVYKGEHTFEDDGRTEIVAIKVLKETASKEAEDDFYREVEIMSAFKHPNILLLLGVVLREGSVSPMMVFEYMRFGDLAEVLRAQRHFYDKLDSEKGTAPVLDDRQLLFIALQVAQGMGYLAAQRFVHRDLACRNCLVTDGPVVKIADFGMSRDVYTCDYYKIGGSRLLPVRWMSPESVVYGRFTLESDVWSYGVVLWEIYNFGKQPYYGHTNEEVMKLILDGVMLTLPEDCPSLIQDIMNSCWKVDPKLRITFDDIGEKLETAFQTYEENHGYNIGCEYERKHKHGANNRSLPRPPPLRMLSEVDILDSQGYLLPKEIKDPIQYLETL